MNISITGSPGSRHKEVGSLLADRLGLTFFSMSDLAEELYGVNPATMMDFRKHKNPELDVKLNVEMIYKIKGEENYVCDGLIASTIVKNPIRIFLEEEFVIQRLLVTEKLVSHQNEKMLAAKFLGFELNDINKYDIYLNRNNLSDKEVVEFILQCLYSGLEGFYVPLWMCLPVTSIQSDTSDGYYRQDQQFHIIKEGSLYYLNGDYKDALRHSVDKYLIRGDVDKVYNSGKMELKSVSSYIKWYRFFQAYARIPILKLMLEIFCAKENIDDPNEAFEHLSQNGDPYNILLGMGYHKQEVLL